MNIDIILPFKEIFSEKKASAVSLTVKNSIEFSEFKKNISVYGQNTDNPFYKKNFKGIKTNKFIHFGNNLSLIKNYLKILKNKKNKNILIEIHNRPYLFNYLIKHISRFPITLYYHNDPTTMKGSKTINERKKIIKKAAGIIFVSEFIKEKFLSGITLKPKNIYVLPNGINRDIIKKPQKEKIVMFVGRLVEEKGAHLFSKAIINIQKKFPDWRFYIIGTSKAGLKKLSTRYEKVVVSSFLKIGNQAKYFGFLPNYRVKKIMESSSILVVPSIWDDPFPLTALEGLASGQAIIASKRGGLVEMLKNTGLLIDDITSKKIELKLLKLMKDKDKLIYYQNKSWKNFKYHQKDISKKQDLLRKKIFNFFINK